MMSTAPSFLGSLMSLFMNSNYETHTFSILSAGCDITHTGSLLYMANIVDRFTYHFAWHKAFCQLALFEFTLELGSIHFAYCSLGFYSPHLHRCWK